MTVPMVVTTINGRWRLKLPEHRAARPEWVTGWERERLDSMHEHLTALCRRAAGPDLGRRPVIVDVGVEEGDLTALYSSWGCDVVMVEPNPRVWPNVRAIWEANELRHPVEWWVGFAGDADTSAPQCDDWARQHVGKSWELTGWPSCALGPVIGDHAFLHLAQHADMVPSIQLDTLTGGQGFRSIKVDAITMDVEGSELTVLRGAHRILREDRPLVWVSVHTDAQWMDENYVNASEVEIDAYMAGHGYRKQFLAEDHERHVFYYPEGYQP